MSAALTEVLDAGVVLTDSGLETELLFHGGFELPCFAAFPLLDDPAGRVALERYYRAHAQIAAAAGVPFVFETPTWRANPDWGAQVGYDLKRLAAVNADAVAFVRGLGGGLPAYLVSGCVGPRGDGYVTDSVMTADEAEGYHSWQVEVLASAGADLVTAMTFTYADEAIGFARAAAGAGIASVIGFTVETDGRLPDGTTLAEAVTRTDGATGAAPTHYLVNCAHPTHFETVLDPSQPWTRRVRAVRANASRMSHAELDEAEQLDDGDPAELGRQYADLRRRLPWLQVLGGCCGTDVRHVQEIARAVLA